MKFMVMLVYQRPKPDEYHYFDTLEEAESFKDFRLCQFGVHSVDLYVLLQENRVNNPYSFTEAKVVTR